MSDHLRVPRACPRCGHMTDATGPATTDEPARPNPGDVQICFRCGMVEIFGDSGQLVPMTAEDWSALDDDERRHFLKLEDSRRRVMGG